MIIRSKVLGLGNVQDITRTVSEARYGGNVTLERHAHTVRRTRNGETVAFRTIVRDSRRAGARRSAEGRRMPVACWHATRDVLAALFDADPDAVVTTALARYDGRDGFHRTFPGTDRNVGSMIHPALMSELCECSDDVRELTYGEDVGVAS